MFTCNSFLFHIFSAITRSTLGTFLYKSCNLHLLSDFFPYLNSHSMTSQQGKTDTILFTALIKQQQNTSVSIIINSIYMQLIALIFSAYPKICFAIFGKALLRFDSCPGITQENFFSQVLTTNPIFSRMQQKCRYYSLQPMTKFGSMQVYYFFKTHVKIKIYRATEVLLLYSI